MLDRPSPGQPGESSRPPNTRQRPATPSPGRSPRPARTGRSPPRSPRRPRRARPATAHPSAFGTTTSTPAGGQQPEVAPRGPPPDGWQAAATSHAPSTPAPATAPDRPVTAAGGAGRQRGADHLSGVRPPQQHRHRQQHMRDQTPSAPRPPWTQRPGMPRTSRARAHPHGRSDPAPRTHRTARRQPRLDPNLICLYRDQRCLRASARPSRGGLPGHSGGRAVVLFVGAILPNLDNLTAPTTSTDNKEKINSSSARY